MYPVLFEFGNFALRSYGLLIAIGTLAGFWFAWRKRPDIQLSEDDLLDLLLILIVICILGAKITYILTHDPLFYFQNPKLIFSGSGLSFIGIVIFGVATCWFYARKKKILFFALMDTVAPGVMIGYAIGRIGCFLNGCCVGIPTQSFLGFRFGSVDNFTRYPTQLFISFLAFVAFFILLRVYNTRKFHGVVFSSFLVLYSIITFGIGFLRDMPKYAPWNLTLNQYSIGIILIVAFWMIYYGSKHYAIIQPQGKQMEGTVETWDANHNKPDESIL